MIGGLAYLGGMVATIGAVCAFVWTMGAAWDRLTLPQYRRKFARRRHPSAGRSVR